MNEYLVKITAKLPMTADILLVRVVAVKPAAFEIVPGAWMQWRIPGPDGTTLRRCFSIACGRQHPDTLEFIIRKTPAGLGTKWLFEQAQLGDELTLAGPNGKFRLQADSSVFPCHAELPRQNQKSVFHKVRGHFCFCFSKGLSAL